MRESGKDPAAVSSEIKSVYDNIRTIKGFEHINPMNVGIGSAIFANKPGDGSAREQAASLLESPWNVGKFCQRICNKALSLQPYQLGYDTVYSQW